jgi:hypothetical protein
LLEGEIESAKAFLLEFGLILGLGLHRIAEVFLPRIPVGQGIGKIG